MASVDFGIQDVEEDEREFKKKQDAERARIAKNRKVQENIDRTREQNAQRKMAKVKSVVSPRRQSSALTPLFADSEPRVGLWEA